MALFGGIEAFKIYGRVLVDTKDMVAGLDEAQRKSYDFSKRLESVGTKLSSIGTRMTTMVTLPIVGGMAAAFNAASNFNESLSKVQVVFGDLSDSVVKWSKTSATAMGISQQAALEAAGTFGNFMQAMGVGQQDAADMSIRLVQLAADLASFNNANPEDVLLALRSGLAGETEPLRKFGVSLSAARVEAEAMSMGIKKSYNEMSAAEKAAISYNIILQDTKMAQGDFARTSDGAANQMRILKAELVDSATKIGNKLIPIGLKLLKMVRGWVDAFNRLSPAAQDSLLKILAFAAAAGPLLKITGTVMRLVGAFKAMRIAAAGAQAAAAAASATGAAASAGGAAGATALAGGKAAGITGLIVMLTAALLYWKKRQDDVAAGAAELVKRIRKTDGSLTKWAENLDFGTLTSRELAEAHKIYRQEQEKVVRRFVWLNDGTEEYTKLLLKNNGLTKQQSEKLVALISGTERMGDGLDDLTLKQVSNLVAVGDVTGALKILRAAANAAATNLSGLAGALEDPRSGLNNRGNTIGNQTTSSGDTNLNLKVVIDRKVFSRNYDLSLRASGF